MKHPSVEELRQHAEEAHAIAGQLIRGSGTIEAEQVGSASSADYPPMRLKPDNSDPGLFHRISQVEVVAEEALAATVEESDKQLSREQL